MEAGTNNHNNWVDKEEIIELFFFGFQIGESYLSNANPLFGLVRTTGDTHTTGTLFLSATNLNMCPLGTIKRKREVIQQLPEWPRKNKFNSSVKWLLRVLISSELIKREQQQQQ